MTRRKVKGRPVGEIETRHGSRVKMWVIEEPADGGVHLTFTPAKKGKNNRKAPTRLGLSRDAMMALAELWRQRIEFEDKRKELSYRAIMLVRRLIPWGWAGIPPVPTPEDFRHVEGTWTLRQPQTQTPEHADKT